ncbi:MAG: hypothetical protein JO157_00485 [Acetobacteraceae bacterium]|nr:hypothetical protein [Acetobacteraceae bacterium]
MRTIFAIVPASMLLATAAWGCNWTTAMAQDDGPGSRMQVAQAQTQGNASRPAREPASQSSVPNAAPPATPDNTTAATDQSPKVKQMNQEAASKVEKEGK